MYAPVEEAVADKTTAVGELVDVDVGLDKVLGIDWSLIDNAALSASAELIAVVAAKLDAARASIAGAVDRSGVWAENKHANAAAMMNTLAPNRHPTAARRDVRLARRLHQMPHAREALQAGQITADHARLLGECLHPRFDGQFTEFEQELIGHAIELSYDDFAKLINAWKQWADDSIEDERDLKDQRARELHLARRFKNRGILKATLTPIARSIIDKELRRLEQQLFKDDWAEAVDRLGKGNVAKDDLARTPAQRRHDALVWMAMRSAQADGDISPSGPDPMIYVHATSADVIEAVEHDARAVSLRVPYNESTRELEDGTPISRRMLTRLLIRARVRRLVFDPQSQVIDAGRDTRWFSRLQRDLIAARDRVCDCGCGLSARLCEADHIIEWRHDGTTDLANGRARCPTSHRSKTNQHNRR